MDFEVYLGFVLLPATVSKRLYYTIFEQGLYHPYWSFDPIKVYRLLACRNADLSRFFCQESGDVSGPVGLTAAPSPQSEAG